MHLPAYWSGSNCALGSLGRGSGGGPGGPAPEPTWPLLAAAAGLWAVLGAVLPRGTEWPRARLPGLLQECSLPSRQHRSYLEPAELGLTSASLSLSSSPWGRIPGPGGSVLGRVGEDTDVLSLTPTASPCRVPPDAPTLPIHCVPHSLPDKSPQCITAASHWPSLFHGGISHTGHWSLGPQNLVVLGSSVAPQSQPSEAGSGAPEMLCPSTRGEMHS